MKLTVTSRRIGRVILGLGSVFALTLGGCNVVDPDTLQGFVGDFARAALAGLLL
ncbi:MAG: hypothetical protein ACE5GE_04205 [Phycisphaerae bacterium]